MSTTQRTTCLVGALAAAVAVAADLVLQYTSNAAHLGSKDYAYLLDVPPDRILAGHFLGVIAVLLEVVGFWGVALGLQPAGRRLYRVFFGVSALAFSVGAAFHAMFASIGLALRFSADSGASPEYISGLAAAVRPAHEGLGAITVTGILLYSLLFSLPVARGRTSYLRWTALCSPVPIVLLLAVTARAFPSLRLVLLPAGLNFANLIFFSVAALSPTRAPRH